MTSLIALYRRRGAVFLVATGLLLVGLLFLAGRGLIDLAAFETRGVHADSTLLRALFMPLAQITGLLFWAALCLLVGVVWARAFFGSSTLIEIFLVGSLLGSVSLPLFYGLTAVLLEPLSRSFLPFTLTLGGHAQVYAFTALSLLLLLGLLALIAREVVKAALKQPA